MASRLLVLLSGVAAVSAEHPPHRHSLINYDAIVGGAVGADAAVAANPTLIKNGDIVVVTYSTQIAPSSNDWIAAYSPPPSNFSAHAPVEWFMANHDPSYMTSGKGQLSFRLINMRADYTFVMYRGGTAKPVLAAQSGNVSFVSVNSPLHPRLAIAPNGITLTWSSAFSTFNPRATITGPGKANVSVPAATSTYDQSNLCLPPATTIGYHSPGVINTALLSGLEAGAVYSYTIGDDTETAGPFSFRTPPPPNSYPFALAVYGDEGQATMDASKIQNDNAPAPNTSALVSAWMDSSNGLVAAVFHNGDLSYARGYATDWEVFLEMNTKIFSRVPYMTDLGNHEILTPSAWIPGTDSGGECGYPATHLLPMPLSDWRKPWYSVVVGSVFNIHFSTEFDFTTGSEQWQFIKSALNSVDSKATPWVFVNFHRPMYLSSTNVAPVGGDQTIAALLRLHVEPLFIVNGKNIVDLTLAGHHHSYQRQSASFNGSVVTRSSGPNNIFYKPAAAVPMMIGTAGAGFSTNIQDPAPAYTEKILFNYGYARVILHNASALEWVFINDLNGRVNDTMWIVK